MRSDVSDNNELLIHVSVIRLSGVYYDTFIKYFCSTYLKRSAINSSPIVSTNIRRVVGEGAVLHVHDRV